MEKLGKPAPLHLKDLKPLGLGPPEGQGWSRSPDIVYECTKCNGLMPANINDYFTCECGAMSLDFDAGRFGSKHGDQAIRRYERVAKPAREATARPSHFWVQMVALGATVIGVLLNLLDVKDTRDFFSVGRDRNDLSVVAKVVASPVAAALTIAWPIAVRVSGRALNARKTHIWLLLALFTIIAWPISCFTSAVQTPWDLNGNVIPR